MPATELHVVDDPIPPGPAPNPPGPGRPQPDPVPSPEPPWPDPLPEPEPRPDDDLAARSSEPRSEAGVRSGVQSDVVVELRGSVAVLFGVVERVEDRERIVDEIGSLASISRVVSNLRPPAA